MNLDATLAAARPRVLAALTRTFRDLDAAEEAFQEACLRALRGWPERGQPENPVAWLVFVGRNAGIDEARRRRRWQELDELTDRTASHEAPEEVLDARQYRDDVLRLLFICCHPELPSSHQIALALKVVAGLTVPEIARAFLVKPKTMEQRLTRAKRRIASADVPFGTPAPAERERRRTAVTSMLYLLFNEGYSASGGEAHVRAVLCEEAIRLARLLLRLFPQDVEAMGLLALLLLQHSRRHARLDAEGELVLLAAQDRARWDAPMIAEGRALVEKALRHRNPGPLQVQAAIAAVHAGAGTPEETDWFEIERLYCILEQLQPTPVVTLNRAVAVAQVRGPAAALEVLAPLTEALDGYFHFHGVRGSLLADVGHTAAAVVELRRAATLAQTPAEASHLRARLRQLEAETD